jgi:tight adherence protein B
MQLLTSVFLIVLFIVLSLGLWTGRQLTERQHQRLAGTRLEGPLGPEPTLPIEMPDWLAPVLRWVADKLAGAGLDFAPEALLLSLIGLALIGAIVARVWVPTGPAIAIGLSIPLLVFFWLHRRRVRRLKTLAQQLPYLLDTLKAAVEAGHTMLRGLQMAAQSSPEPLASEIRAVVDRVRVGMGLPLALEAMYRRVPIDDLNFLADAVLVQEEAGSSMAQILQHTAESIRSRQRLDEQIMVLTSQSRMSARIVAALPGLVLAVFSLIHGDYVQLLFHNPVGTRILVAAIVMDVTAFLIMREIARVDY